MNKLFKNKQISKLEKRKKELMHLISINMDSYEFTNDVKFKEKADEYVHEFNEVEKELESLEES
jgi:hypothetical protein